MPDPSNTPTLDAVLQGRVSMADLRITSEALETQAQIAQSAGRLQLAENLRRAAELVGVSDEMILSIYNALRPNRASATELEEIATMLERQYAAHRCAALIREAAQARR